MYKLNPMRLMSGLGGLLFRDRIATEIDEELRIHIAMRIREYVHAGMTPRKARSMAIARFGSIDDARADCRAIQNLPPRPRNRGTTMHSIWQDLRFAIRGFFKRPSFTIVAIVTLALGIGANTAIFSAVHSILLRPMPFPGGDRIVQILLGQEGQQVMILPDRQNLDAWREYGTLQEGMVGYSNSVSLLQGTDEPQYLRVALVTSDLLSFLGSAPLLGRPIGPTDTERGAERVAMLSESTWRVRYGADRNILNTPIGLGEEIYTVIGVLPKSADLFFGVQAPEVWLPLQPTDGSGSLRVSARFPKGVDEEAVIEELTRIREGLRLGERSLKWTPTILHHGAFLGSDFRRGLWVMFGAVGFVLLIACANVSNMLLARAVGRGHEIAVRTALGARRGRVMRQLMIESLTLAALGAALGFVLAVIGLEALRQLAPAEMEELRSVRLDPIVLTFTAVLATVSGLIFGLVPAAQVSAFDISTVLNQGTRTGASGARGRLRQLIIAIEVAVALVLFLGAGLMVNSFLNLQRRDSGFRPANLVMARLVLDPTQYPEGPVRTQLIENILSRVRQLPGVESATLALGVPPRFGGRTGQLEFDPPAVVDAPATFMAGNLVTPSYFEVVGTPITTGRGFAPEGQEIPNPAVVSEDFATTFWPGEDPLGKKFRFYSINDWNTVIGVARNVNVTSNREHDRRFQIYTPWKWRSGFFSGGTVIARVTEAPDATVSLIQDQIWSVDRTLRIGEAGTVEDILADTISRPRFNATMLSGFAAIALFLASIGVYGVISLSVQLRAREIGVRVALGAEHRDILQTVLGYALVPIVLGVAGGLAASLGLTRLLRSLLFGVAPTDPVTYAVGVVTLLGAGLLASYLPARRACRVDPVEVLRAE